MGSLIDKNGFSTRITVILIALERKKSGAIRIGVTAKLFTK